MNYSSRFIFTLGCLTLILSSNFFVTTAHALGRAHNAPTDPVPVPDPVATPAPTATPVTSTPKPVGTPKPSPVHTNTSCVSSDPEHMCMGVKMESFTKNGNPVLSEIQAEVLLAGINKVWASCNIAFQLEKYEMVDPATQGLDYDVNWLADGDSVRSKFEEKNTFLVVSVGQLTGSTIGVTEVPGAGVYGSIIEEDYAQNELTVGHELGHYMGLYHVWDTSNLMSSRIGPNTRDVYPSQCDIVRSTNNSNWQAMMRH